MISRPYHPLISTLGPSFISWIRSPDPFRLSGVAFCRYSELGAADAKVRGLALRTKSLGMV